jgi:aquaporin Z
MNRYIAEFLGTFVLVFASCGTAVLAGDKVGFLGVSLAFGLSLLAMVYAIGPISGCHINPAVTIGILLSKKMEAKYAGGYIVAQIVGAIVAAGLLLIIVQRNAGRLRSVRGGFRRQWLRRALSRSL